MQLGIVGEEENGRRGWGSGQSHEARNLSQNMQEFKGSVEDFGLF